MKKYFLLLALIFILTSYYLIFSKGTYVDTFWNGNISKKLPSEIQVELIGSKLKVLGFLYSPMETVSYIDYEIVNNEIHISNYAKLKYINFFPKNPIFINLDRQGIYKVFYKNGDGSFDFIKDIEVK